MFVNKLYIDGELCPHPKLHNIDGAIPGTFDMSPTMHCKTLKMVDI